ncbi:MAG: (S)-2-hydroxyglutarate dehydrogenase [Verrucomicrobiota bacterium]
MRFDCAVIGGGVVGLATAMVLGQRRPELKLIVLEKESEIARHQTGRNSGVIHSGIYYKPGSLKARFAREGNRKMVEFCTKHGVSHEVCGKVIVATNDKELPLLEELYRRGLENGLAVRKLSSEEVREIEPHVRCKRGLAVPSTGIVNYREVCLKYVGLIEQQGGVVKTGVRAGKIEQRGRVYTIETTAGAIETGFLINCGGLQSDRLARQAGQKPEAKIVPFRGEYYELVPKKRHLVRTLVYPVPNPQFPFLGVHFTRMIDGSVHAGPNAVLAFKREGYRKTDFDFSDLRETLAYRGFWKLARRHYKEGFAEIYRSLSKAAFVRSLQRLVPEVRADDLIPASSGVRAQALMPDGKLVDDFLIMNGQNSIHVCNAPSPAATASLEIGAAIAEKFLRFQ